MIIILGFMTTTPYIPVRVDSRGSINLPSDIKQGLNITLSSTLLVRRVNGLVVLIPLHGEAEQALQEDRLGAWVDFQLGTPVAPMPVHASSKLATAEALKIQAARERFEHKKELLRLQADLRPRRIPLSQKYQTAVAAEPPPAAAVPLEQDPMLAEFRAAREADATRQLNAALQQASDDMAGGQPPLPQA